MRAVTVVLLSLSLLLMACGPDNGGAGGDEKQQADDLEAARARVLDDVTPVLSDLGARLPAQLRFSSGKYNACKNDFSGATAVTYAVNGRLDLSGAGPVSLDAVRAAFTDAGFEVEDEDDGITVAATKGDTSATVSTLEGEPALLFAARDDGCYEVGGDRARAYSVDKDPITLG
ncbi:MAG: hypothetical protein ABWX84_15130 [Nocardioides sp.]